MKPKPRLNAVAPERVNNFFFLMLECLKAKHFEFENSIEITATYKSRNWWGSKNAQAKVFLFSPLSALLSVCMPSWDL